MKIGSNDQPRLIVATALMTVALVTTGMSIYGWQSSARVVAASNPPAEIEARKPSRKKKHENPLDPTLRYAQLELTENQQYTGTGRNIFQIYLEDEHKTVLPDPKPNPTVRSEQRVTPMIPLRFFGFATMRNTPRKVCIRDDDAVFIASEGEVVDRRYKIATIRSTSVDVEDLIENRQQTLTLQHD